MTKIFLVEDDSAIAKNLMLLLESEGFAAVHTAMQKEAVALSMSEKFDLALIDISLPDGNGFTVYTAIKQSQNIPVLFLTASGDEISVVTGLNMGADDYIIKPFRPMELIARIKAALRKTGYTPSIYEIADLFIDTSGGTVKKNGTEVFLSALEYRLLLVFLNNQKTVISRNRLLDELWDAGGDFVNDNTLTVYIKRLREKIENNPADPQIILTVRGMGYRLGDRYVQE
ncbi:MAG: response regulator transcription factor [Oscillospiraceae bacterium]|jgi:DNA-binding response OmpR family regulator|nr:response regulator transcription factor [Oscillospiraceae bacterium]